MKIYIENSVLGLLFESVRKNFSDSGCLINKIDQTKALSELLKITSLNFYISEDLYSEIKKSCQNTILSKGLKQIADKFNYISLQHRVSMDGTYRFSHGTTFGGKYPKVKDQIKNYLKSQSKYKDDKEHEYDARHLSNCYKNDIKYFITIDTRTILKYKDGIYKKFFINIITPLELKNRLKQS